MSTSPNTPPPNERADLEIRQLRKEIEKLELEIDALKSGTRFERTFGRYLPVITALLAVAGFWFGVIQYNLQRSAGEKEREDSIRREAARPFWESQIKFYMAASEAAATIATTKDEDTKKKAKAVFWMLYYGPLACVEDVVLAKPSESSNEAGKVVVLSTTVESAMVNFGSYLLRNPEHLDEDEVKNLSLKLSQAIRDKIGPAFDLYAIPLKGDREKTVTTSSSGIDGKGNKEVSHKPNAK